MSEAAPVIDRPDTDTDNDLDEAFGSIVDNETAYKGEDDDSGNHDKFSHYVNKEDIVKAATTGEAVFAICGKKWTPRTNPQGLTICPECIKVYEMMKPE